MALLILRSVSNATVYNFYIALLARLCTKQSISFPCVLLPKVQQFGLIFEASCDLFSICLGTFKIQQSYKRLAWILDQEDSTKNCNLVYRNPLARNVRWQKATNDKWHFLPNG